MLAQFKLMMLILCEYVKLILLLNGFESESSQIVLEVG